MNWVCLVGLPSEAEGTSEFAAYSKVISFGGVVFSPAQMNNCPSWSGREVRFQSWNLESPGQLGQLATLPPAAAVNWLES